LKDATLTPTEILRNYALLDLNQSHISFSYLNFSRSSHLGKRREVLGEREDNTKLCSPQFFWMKTISWNPRFRFGIHLRALGQEVYIFMEIHFSHL